MITVPDLIMEVSSYKIMDDIAEIGPAIILDMRKNRKVKEPEEECKFQKEELRLF